MMPLISKCTNCPAEFEGTGLQCPECRSRPRSGERRAPLELIRGKAEKLAPFSGHVRVTLPWTALASDNLRTSGVHGAESKSKRGQYDEALQYFRLKLRAEYKGEPFAGPARIVCVFYVPDNGVRDPTFNFAKIIGDGLKGILIQDDKWQVARRTSFEVEGIDRDRPRCEITVEAIAP